VHPIARQSSIGLTSPSSTVQTLIAFISSIPEIHSAALLGGHFPWTWMVAVKFETDSICA
jgi:hypothetical protein